MKIISIFQYSQILSIGTLALAAAVIVSVFGFLFSQQIRTKLTSFDYYTYLKIIGAIAISSTIGALIYQFYYYTPVCVLCWWQRIFLFPIDVIVLIAIWEKEKAAHITAGILAFVGSLFAYKHYYGHFQIHVQKNTEYIMTCDAYGSGGPDCGATLVQTFGFVTIPLMGLVAFVSIVWLAFLAGRARAEKNLK